MRRRFQRFWRFSGFSTVWPPQTAGVTDNPRPPPLSGEPPIGLGAGGKDPGPGGHPGGPLSRRRRPVSWGGTRREVLRFRLPCGTPLARHAPPSPTEDGAGVRAGRVCGRAGAQLNSNNRAELGWEGCVGQVDGNRPPEEGAFHAFPQQPLTVGSASERELLLKPAQQSPRTTQL